MIFDNLKNNVFLAPMAGITDLPFRKMVMKFGAGLVFTEMLSANAMIRDNDKKLIMGDIRDEDYSIAAQISGSQPDVMAAAAKMCQDLGAYSIDINMGCPVKKIINNQAGSYLMTDMDMAARIISEVKGNIDIPLSVKFRSGWDENTINADEFAKMCENEGADFLIIHPRTRMQFYSGKADWNIIKSVKKSVNIPVVGNGDIFSGADAKAMIDKTNADAVMVGRGIMGAPWLVNDVDRYLNGLEVVERTVKDVRDNLLEHLSLMIDYYGEYKTVRIARKHVGWYCKGLRDVTGFRENINKIDDYKELIKYIENYLKL